MIGYALNAVAVQNSGNSTLVSLKFAIQNQILSWRYLPSATKALANVNTVNRRESIHGLLA